jgi:ABC-type transport system involved in Fe-S cluster assembly fused permease/ATPase subunit
MGATVGPESVDGALEALRYVYPATIFIAYCVAAVVSAVKLHAIKAAKNKTPQTARRRVSLGLIAVIIVSYLAQLGLLLTNVLFTDGSAAPDSVVVGWLSAVLVFGIQFAHLEGDKHPVWYTHVSVWILSSGFEVALVILSALEPRRLTLSLFDGVQVALAALRVCVLAGLIGMSAAYHYHATQEKATDEERQGLLSGTAEGEAAIADGAASATASGYGATAAKPATAGATNTTDDKDKDKKKQDVKILSYYRRRYEGRQRLLERLQSEGNIFTYIKGFSLFWPHIWPAKSRSLQIRIALIGCCMVIGNALNLLVPRQFGVIMDDLSADSAMTSRIWLDVGLYIAFRIAASESGISLVRSWLMIKVRSFSSQSLQIASYSHFMHLSSDFHDSISKSELWHASYGGVRMTMMLERILFTAVPMFVDMALAFVYLSTILGPYEAFISIASGIMFVHLAARMVARRDGAVRELEEYSSEETHIKNNGIDAWQAVNTFNQVDYECNRYGDAVRRTSVSQRKVQFNWQISSALQSFVLMAGLAASAGLAVVRIREGKATPGQFATLLSYWAQLSAPLRYFVDLGKDTKDDLIYCERLRDIMLKKPSIANNGTKKPLKFERGEVCFDNVSFGYDKEREIITKLSFTAEGGKTIALVGATGSGKSTILKLLNRFYDVSDGSIRIDGQDVREVDLFSLRDRIGVVPQAISLFADTVMNNVRYAKLSATDEEVYEACKAACIHDKILTFTDGYDSFVGDRGV